jgi:hypothetical protein
MDPLPQGQPYSIPAQMCNYSKYRANLSCQASTLRCKQRQCTVDSDTIIYDSASLYAAL